MVELKGYKAESVSFENKVANGTRLELKNQVKYNVNYLDNSNKCVGFLDFRISDANLNPFELKIQLIAEFTYDSTDTKPDIHVQSFDQIFPFLRQIINTVTSISGMPGLMIPIMHLDKNRVATGTNPPSPVSNDDGEHNPLN